MIVDLHIHSKYSRATSKALDFENIAQAAIRKGIDVVATSDFTHPQWLKEIEVLEPAEKGLFKCKGYDTRFLLSTEISCIYKKNDRTRKIHILVLAPSIEVVKKINTKLEAIGNIHSDGRPILGLDAKELLKIVLDVSEDCMIIPAHAWTPWFSIFGSKSGFDSIEECFDEYSKYIYAIETGLSSDPAMNWRISALDNITLISNSDAHSAEKLGREANVLDVDMSYSSIVDSIKTRKGFLYTIEFYPQEGRYHYDGHRSCEICLSPEESKKYNDVCPVCGKPLTLGVVHRVEELADREIGIKPETAIPFKSIIPLKEIIAESFDCGVNTKKVQAEYDKLMEIGSEFHILLDADIKGNIGEAILRARNGDVTIEPGYDGVFGKVGIFSKQEKKELKTQKVLFD